MKRELDKLILSQKLNYRHFLRTKRYFPILLKSKQKITSRIQMDGIRARNLKKEQILSRYKYQIIAHSIFVLILLNKLFSGNIL